MGLRVCESRGTGRGVTGVRGSPRRRGSNRSAQGHEDAEEPRGAEGRQGQVTGVGVFEASRLLLVTGLADAASGCGTNMPGLCSLVVSGFWGVRSYVPHLALCSEMHTGGL